MTSPYERTIAALKRRQPDRVPIFCFRDETSPGTSDRFRDFVTSHADVFYSRILYTGFQCTGLEPARTETNIGEGWVESTYRFNDGIEFSDVYKNGDNGDYIGFMSPR